jgi:hypothetical protein
VYGLYGEARRAMTPGAFTAAALVLRKLLMNIAVAEGADTDRNFVGYVDYLEEHHYSPPKGRAWVDHIRRKGNEATHEIPDITREDAEELLAFAETLLKYLYEFPSRVAPDAEPTE